MHFDWRKILTTIVILLVGLFVLANLVPAAWRAKLGVGSGAAAAAGTASVPNA
jgi:hypothetical protein